MMGKSTAESADEPSELKAGVREHWERETCGTRYGGDGSRPEWLERIAKSRYELEPFIPAFAGFPSARGLEVLEIGVGAGVDFTNWCRYAKRAAGVDLTRRAIEITTERLAAADIPTDRYVLEVADAESLPFDDAAFDLVYSWGVLHHTPDTAAAFREASRVLKPGGRIRAMIYHVPSWTGLLVAARHGWLRGDFRMTQKEALFHNLESPGTKAYSLVEAKNMIETSGFEEVAVWTEFAVSDLLTLELSSRYRSPLFALARAVYPRWLVRRLGRRWGLNLMITARKPER